MNAYRLDVFALGTWLHQESFPDLTGAMAFADTVDRRIPVRIIGPDGDWTRRANREFTYEPAVAYS